jgi:hypothetical protein
MISKRDKLTLPLKSHGYLLEIIAGYGNKAEAKAEAQTEARRGGHTPVGRQTQTPPNLPLSGEASSSSPDKGKGERVRSTMPESVKAILKKRNNDGKQ